MNRLLEPLFDHIRLAKPSPLRPHVTLTFAQSLDGSIASAPGETTAISSDESLQMTHCLRGLHDSILVGVGTILVDNPELTVRHAPGEHPQPVILDSALRTPPDARVLKSFPRPLIVHGTVRDNGHLAELQRAGAHLMAIDSGLRSPHDLQAVMLALRQQGLERLMIEGGARIIHSALEAGIVDLLVLTVAPQLLGGLNPYCADITPPMVSAPQWQAVGRDMVFWGELTARSP